MTDKKKEPRICAGCEKDLGIYGGETFYPQQVAPGEPTSALLCRGRTSGTTSTTCRLKLLSKHQLCPGCGGFAIVGTICRECVDALEDHRKRLAQKSRSVKPFIVSTYALSCNERGTVENNEELMKLLARAAAGKGRYFDRQQDRRAARDEIIGVIPKDDPGQRHHTPSGPIVELTEEQAEALGKAYLHIRELLRERYAEGAASGRSLLLALANGEVTASEFDDRSARQTTQSAPERKYTP